MKVSYYVIIGILIIFLGGLLIIRSTSQFDLPEGETLSLSDSVGVKEEQDMQNDVDNTKVLSDTTILPLSEREVFVTDGVKHSIPLDEILSGGPPKDGIPSIDNPKFVSTSEADKFLLDDSIGLGVSLNGEVRFYPYMILVWHEIVNDIIGNDSVLVSYCPLCATGIIFERRVDGEVQEFGVSGKLWKSNLLMYNRTGDENTESLWSQALGEAVLGPATGKRLKIIQSDTVRYNDWKQKYPDTVVLSRETGSVRTYGADPYGDYYINNTVSFGATFDDNRLGPKAFVFGIEIDGKAKAYNDDSLPEGVTTDTFAGKTIIIEKDEFGTVGIFADGEELTFVSGFWFAWLEFNPSTELFTN